MRMIATVMCALVVAGCVKQEPAMPSEPAAARFRVISATYGVDTRLVNVTEKVQELLDDREEVQAWPELLGVKDPAEGTVKTLIVEVEVNKETMRWVLPDGGRVLFLK